MQRNESILAAGGALAGLSAAVAFKTFRRAQARRELQTVSWVDLERYQGRWFEIARYPARFERQCAKNAQAHYAIAGTRRVRVTNQCTRADGSIDVRTARARVVDRRTNARLAVRFFPLAPRAPYWIIDLDPAYRFAVVGEPSRRYLWILAREPRLDDAAFNGICERLRTQGYDPARLERTLQD